MFTLDIIGLIILATCQGSQSDMQFIDVAICFTFLYHIKTKDQTFKYYLKLHAFIKTQFGITIKKLNVDSDQIYMNKQFTEIAAENRTILYSRMLYTLK